MNKLIAIVYFVLSLYGCDVGNSTFIHRIQSDGNDTLYSKVDAQPGVARFECLRSASGRCYYTLFPRECVAAPARATRSAPASTRGTSDGCLIRPVERFAIANGEVRQVAGLPRFRLCVSGQNATPGPDCGLPEPIAAR